MATVERAPTIALITIPRAVLSLAASVVSTVERAVRGDAHIRTARSNAWEAMCADRARLQARDDIRRAVEALGELNGPDRTVAGAQLSVGSSPRSSASQASLVSTAA
ncbi:MAG TPA: hypothetical protein VFO77_14505 [Actinoplanes sp.]|nr:hypothetical protein [Actinoplanes sp.]